MTTGEGGMSRFEMDLNGHIWGLGCPGRSNFFLFQSLDLSGPTWGEARAEKYLHPSGTPPEVAAP